MKKVNFFLCIIVLVLSFTSYSQEGGSQYELFKSKTYVKNPMELRDPFKRRINKKKTQSAKSRTKDQMNGIYNNFNNSIESKSIESLRIIGVILGTERRAMAKFIDDRDSDRLDPLVYYIKEGMKIGENGAEVKAILPGGIVLVEKIRNVYDQDEYLETIIPVSND